MILNVRNRYFKDLKKRGGTVIDDYTYRQDENMCSIESNRLTAEDMKLLKDIAQEAYDKTKEPGSQGLLRKISLWAKLQEKPDTTKISNLDGLVEAVRLYFKDTPNKWIFKQEDDGEMVAYYLVKAEYEPPDPKHMSPACTTLELQALCRGSVENKKITFHHDDLGVPLTEMLSQTGLNRETPEMVTAFLTECERYKAIAGLTGEQFMAKGQSFNADRYEHGLIEMEVDGQFTRVVMDDVHGDESDNDDDNRHRGRSRADAKATVETDFWRKGQRGNKFDEEDNPEDIVVLPTQPYVLVFDLIKHRHVITHVNNLEEYKYDVAMVDKLILPEADKDLIHILVEGADEQMEDIVKGKTGGIIVIATGPPGTGKTLTAETFSECVKRPLYSVQCSQLGTSPAGLEKKLVQVLGRASRWKAILLIDEADVYIHERGADIDQNAIVGVWLRILEYYKGIMFMTSNRSTIIDDAIMSRATAWIRYERPTATALRRIWQVLAAQYKVTLTVETIDSLVSSKTLGHISGRTVKNLLKLARLLSKRKKELVTVKMLEYVSQYLDIDKEENENNVLAGRQIDAGGRHGPASSPRSRSRSTRVDVDVEADE